MRKSLIWLLEALNNQIKLTDVPEEHRWLAQWHLPNLATDLAEQKQVPSETFEDFHAVTESMTRAEVVQVLAATPITTLMRLLGGFLSLLPISHLTGLQQLCVQDLGVPVQALTDPRCNSG
ncbi:MAG: hypothetical protein HC895_03675 [Leptolyngbyaceae cyanobacterium SM1_3_5]|nr:hypothetical protein [Leptolyngbyaceae cyanobacterium SM1_3_5]